MPRFHLSLTDAGDLVSYIKRLGEAVDPGISESSIRLGVLLPPRSTFTDGPAATRQSLLEYFRGVNAAGGLFDRRIELKFGDLPADPRQRAQAALDFLGGEQVFAVIGDFTGAESEIAANLRETGTPAIAALAPFPPSDSSQNPFVFYLDGGVTEELDALAAYASEHFSRKDLPIAIVASDSRNERETARWLAEHLTNSGRTRVVVQEDPRLKSAGLVFWVRPDFPAGASGNTTFLVPSSLSWDRRAATASPMPHVLFALRSLTLESHLPRRAGVVPCLRFRRTDHRSDETGRSRTLPPLPGGVTGNHTAVSAGHSESEQVTSG